MKAISIRKYGGTDVLDYVERPHPTVEDSKVVVRVHSASINPRDWLLMRGKYPFRFLTPPFPLTLGSDVSGVVESLGPNARRFTPGDAVFGMQSATGGMGAFAEYVVMPENVLAEKPESVSHDEVAAVPCAGLTAYQALKRIGRVDAGDNVLVNGASGGVGTYAIQIAKLLGAEVTAVASDGNRQLCTTLGADRFIDYKNTDFTKSRGKYHLVFDVIGRSSPSKCKNILTKSGRFITTVPKPATITQAIISPVSRLLSLGKRPSVHVVLVRASSADLKELAEWLAKGSLRSVIDSTYPLSDAREAFEKSQTWRTRGKIVLHVTAEAFF